MFSYRILSNVFIAMFFVLASASTFAEVYKAPSPEPTPEETLILEYMNRFRADPAADADRMIPSKGNKTQRWIKVDWKMFEDEMKAVKKAPPLVFNLKLLDAARKHSFYMIHNGLTHNESAGKTGYTGDSFGQRCKAAGYTGGASGENCYQSASSPWFSHLGFVVDFGKGGPGGMQPGRGHRTNMANSKSREVGPGAVPHPKGSKLSVTHNFGRSRAARLAGGVVYVDKNRNGFYDIGEGRGGIQISASDGSSVTTWKSGAYTLKLNSTAALILKAELGSQSTSKNFEAGKTNVKFDWIIPEEAELEMADKLLLTARTSKDQDPKGKAHFKALIALYMGTEGIALDTARRKEIDTFTKEVGPNLKAAKKTIMDALGDLDLPKFQKTLRTTKKPYSGTSAEAWFKEAEMIANAKASTLNFEMQMETKKVSGNLQRGFVKHLEGLSKQLKIAEFKAESEALLGRVKNLTSPQRPQRGRR